MKNADARPALMVGLGEVLWDVLPSGAKFGGAPANFAYMAAVLGNHGIIASRIGCDELGGKTRLHVQQLGLNPSYMQSDDQYPTGTAEVQIDTAGQPTFTIKGPAAWDHLEWNESWESLAATANAVCYGSLAQRSHTSAATIEKFLQAVSAHTIRICDINLRAPFYSKTIIDRCLASADIVKLNDQELVTVCELLAYEEENDLARCRRLIKAYGLKIVCLTRGSRGSLLVSSEQAVEHPGFKVQVADAVGAGDAFTACLVHHYLHGKSLEFISNVANRFASWVATQAGATPEFDVERLHDILYGNDVIANQRA